MDVEHRLPAHVSERWQLVQPPARISVVRRVFARHPAGEHQRYRRSNFAPEAIYSGIVECRVRARLDAPSGRG